MKLGVIADDNTGATDAAGMLTERGVRTLLVLDVNAAISPAELDGFEALVVGTQNRSIAPAAAAEATRGAVKRLREWGVDRFQIKYCSTFDSTRAGNIGPTLDAALDALAAPATIVCPALPINGRTVYQGHLFVGSQLLSESPLRNHPLNPMTDANLVRWLGYQTARKVGLVELPIVRRGIEATRQRLDACRAEGCSYLVTDVVSNEDLLTLAAATRDWPLTSGGSGITAAMAAVHFPGRETLRFEEQLSHAGPTTLVVSGSQSPATRRQMEHALAHGWMAIRLDVPAVLQGHFDLGAAASQAERELSAGRPVLIGSSSEGDTVVADVLALGRTLGFTDVQTGTRIAETLAELALRLVSAGHVDRLVVSGGETSGAVCKRLGIRAIEVGLPLAPGVPYGFTWPDRKLLLVLKSGNFAGDDLYQRVRGLLRIHHVTRSLSLF